jgi:Tol biopolymer transport system component
MGEDYHDEDGVPSPDGTRVAFTTTRFDRRTWDIAVLDRAGGPARRVTTHPAFERHAAWTPDGRSLLFSSAQDGTQAVFRAWLDTGRIARVSPMPERALMPTVSPDGGRVAYTIGTPDGFRVVVQDLESGARSPLTPAGDSAVEPAWSPDGTRLAYTRLTEAGALIVVLTVATGAVVPLAVEGWAALREPAWSPDGTWIAAAGSRRTVTDEDWDLLLLRPEPPAAFRLTDGPANDRAPSWMGR